jgi:hypothetical protein
MKTNDYIIEKPRKEILDIKINANSHRGLILSLLSRIRNNVKDGVTYSNYELIAILEEALRKYDELKKVNEKANVIYSLVGWKGQDFPEIFNDGEQFTLREHRKSKDGEVEELNHLVPYSNVNTILKIVKKLKIGETVDCYYISKELGYSEWKDLWKERKTYFESYYYPIKVLESMMVIDYSSKGKTKRLK